MSPFLPVIVALACAAADGAGTDVKSPAPTGDWRFSLSVGPAARQSGTFRFDGGSRSGGIAIPSFVGQDSLTVPPIGDAGAYGDRFYNDGFDRQDPSTAVDGFTTYWGNQQSSQVNGDNHSIHATGYESVRPGHLGAARPRLRSGNLPDQRNFQSVSAFRCT